MLETIKPNYKNGFGLMPAHTTDTTVDEFA